MKAFYNTTGESGTTLADFTEIAQDQEKRIYSFVKAHPHMEFSREDLRHLFLPNTLTTSIVRSLCNLKDMGIIEVVGKTMGTRNRPIFVYKYCEKKQEELW